ncbi:39977_t:CDS:2, partial [Gigaspora margarita]
TANFKEAPGPGKQKADNLAMDHFLDSLAEDTGLPEDFYGDDDPVEDLRKQFDDLTLNVAKLAKDELEKSLYTTLESKAEINDLCEKLQKCYEKLLEYIFSRDNSINKEKIDLKSAVLSGIELLLGIGSDMRIDLDQDLELLFFISVLRGVDSGYKVFLPICLKFSDEVDETSVDIGNISVEMVLCIICC